MAKFTETWENYDRFYDDFQREGLNFDDLQLKNKFVFHDRKFTVSSKSRLNFGEKAAAAHEVSLKHKCSKGHVEIKEKGGSSTSLEIENQVYNENNIKAGLFFKSNNLFSESGKLNDSKLQLRLSKNDNLQFFLGTEKWNVSDGAPKLFSFGGSHGRVTDSHKVITNALAYYNNEKKALDKIRFFVKASKGNIVGLVENTVLFKKDQENKPSKEASFTASFVNEISKQKKIGGSISFSPVKNTVDAEVVGSYVFDRLRFNGKINSKREIFGGITSVHDDITLVLSGKAKINTSDKRIFVDQKYGLSLEFNRL